MDNFRILVIDDEEIVRESLSDWLKKFGFYVETAENGAKGVRVDCEQESKLGAEKLTEVNYKITWSKK